MPKYQVPRNECKEIQFVGLTDFRRAGFIRGLENQTSHSKLLEFEL